MSAKLKFSQPEIMFKQFVMSLLSILMMSIIVRSRATPLCCELSFECLNDQRVNMGYYAIGKKLRKSAQNLCQREGRGNWCVAEWTDGVWYCTSPGGFISDLDGYSTMCKGGVFPMKDPTASCCRYGEDIAGKCEFALERLMSMSC